MLSVGHVTITNTDPSKKKVYPWWPEDIGYQFLLSIHIHATKEFTLCRAFGYHKHKFPLKIDQGFLITREAINIRKNISILLVLISLKLDLANRSMNLWWHSDNSLRLLQRITSGVPQKVEVVPEDSIPSLHSPKSVKTIWPCREKKTL